MRENVIRLVVVGILAAVGQPALAKNCGDALARKPRSAKTKTAAAAETPVTINPTELLQKLTEQVQLSRKANDLGFEIGKSATRPISKAEAMPFVSLMLRTKQLDANKTATDIANIQLHGHFDNLRDIGNVLASAYASNLDPKSFAQSLASIQVSVQVPNTHELGYNATDLRRPDLSESMTIFNIIVLNKGDARKTQEEIVDVADALNSGDLQVITAVIEEADARQVAAVDLAHTVAKFATEVQLQKRVIGFGPQSETVNPTALEAVELLQIAGAMKIPADQFVKVVNEIQAQTDATDFASIIETLTESLKPTPKAG